MTSSENVALHIEIVQHNDITVFRPVGWVRLDNHHIIDERLKDLVDQGHRRFVVDLSMAHFVSSTSLGVLLFYRQSLEAKGGCLLLAAPSPAIWKMLSASGLARALETCATVEDALRKSKHAVGSGRLEPVET